MVVWGRRRGHRWPKAGDRDRHEEKENIGRERECKTEPWRGERRESDGDRPRQTHTHTQPIRMVEIKKRRGEEREEREERVVLRERKKNTPNKDRDVFL
jgi:hypothetical protein